MDDRKKRGRKSYVAVMDTLQRPVMKKKGKGEWVNVHGGGTIGSLALYTESIQQCELNLDWGKKNDGGRRE